MTVGPVAASLDELAAIGADPAGGVTRVAWSPGLLEAYDWVGRRMRDLGLEVEVDAAGNLLGRWEAGTGPAVLVGSHLDTVPRGGRLDGAFGVLAAVHAVASLRREGFEPARPVWIVAFMDEEGARFNAALFGSRAFVGDDVTRFGGRVDAEGTTLREAMTAAGFALERAAEARRIGEIGAYLELHIEQGPVLEAEAVELGLVTSIVGLRGYRVRLGGQANHAGTTPMRYRRDALAGAARILLALREAAHAAADAGTGATANVGKIEVHPGGANVVPGLADFTVDVRSPTAAGLAELERLVEETVASVAREEGLTADVEQTFALEPLQLDPGLVDVLERAAAAVGASSRRMPSGAGHDAMLVGRHVPAAMLFVPSRGGISHSPAEDTDARHLELGTQALVAALRELLGVQAG
jgi:hydantoinase/carbamoylase family amidase